jgi:hypothetical protein
LEHQKNVINTQFCWPIDFGIMYFSCALMQRWVKQILYKFPGRAF